jgi:hypothetical protein
MSPLETDLAVDNKVPLTRHKRQVLKDAVL